MNAPLSQLQVLGDPDIPRLRQHARAIADRLGFEPRDRAGIASAVSLVAREAVRRAGGGLVEFHLEGDPPRSLMVRVVDRGPGRPDPKSPGLPDLDRARRLMDSLDVDASTGPGLAVSMARALPPRSPSPSPEDAARIAGELLGLEPPGTVDEMLRQDCELIQALDELRAGRQALDEISQGALALHEELDERGDSLKKAGEMRTRFLANVSHELRTPLSSILSLARLLLDRADGELTVEQERQVSFILRAARDLSGLVNDLLDLARIEAGRESIRPSEVHLPEFFALLRGMLRPLQEAGSPVSVVFEDPAGLPPIRTDEGKLAQVLRGFLSNALKFTRSGEVRVKAERGPGDCIVFSVSDTGIGIETEHLDWVFEEFGQVDTRAHRPTPGSGLGLPLAWKLARLLGGHVEVRSQPGVGSTFTATIPILFPGEVEQSPCDPGI
jgi:signal transduction histidine kinase